MQEYLNSLLFSDLERKMLISFRSRMVTNFKMNFKSQHLHVSCQLKCNLLHTDSQENLLLCPILKEKINPEVAYSDIFPTITKQNIAIKSLIHVQG